MFVMHGVSFSHSPPNRRFKLVSLLIHPHLLLFLGQVSSYLMVILQLLRLLPMWVS